MEITVLQNMTLHGLEDCYNHPEDEGNTILGDVGNISDFPA
jgi:hypothetical protein